jgi:phosphatidylglycerol---prolipoprotein diacylglyceryl transferase
MMSALIFPNFNPVAVHLGPFAIRWYALAYIAALLLGWRLLNRLVREAPAVATTQEVDDFLSWATLGVVLGGRFGYVLLYQPGYYFTHPLMIAAVWDGGMSFHGGLIGVVIAIFWFCRRNGIAVLGFADRIAVTVPIGLFLGRIANFINGELWGRQAPGWWPLAMIYPRAGPIPRYPSQLYEALLEGLVLFAVMYSLSRHEDLRLRGGFLTGGFLLGYAIARIVGECFRQPDWFLGYLLFGVTMGQLLSLPLIPVGAWLIVSSRRRPVCPRPVEASR